MSEEVKNEIEKRIGEFKTQYKEEVTREINNELNKRFRELAKLLPLSVPSGGTTDTNARSVIATILTALHNIKIIG